MYGNDHFRYGRHADDVGADRAQESVLGARLEVRSTDGDVDALTQLDAARERDGARQHAQFRIVCVGHVRKARTETIVVRPGERIVAEQIDVVGDEHEIAGAPQRMHAAARIGDDQCFRA